MCLFSRAIIATVPTKRNMTKAMSMRSRFIIILSSLSKAISRIRLIDRAITIHDWGVFKSFIGVAILQFDSPLQQ